MHACYRCSCVLAGGQQRATCVTDLMQGHQPIGARAGAAHDGAVDWGHLKADVVQVSLPLTGCWLGGGEVFPTGCHNKPISWRFNTCPPCVIALAQLLISSLVSPLPALQYGSKGQQYEILAGDSGDEGRPGPSGRGRGGAPLLPQHPGMAAPPQRAGMGSGSNMAPLAARWVCGRCTLLQTCPVAVQPLAVVGWGLVGRAECSSRSTSRFLAMRRENDGSLGCAA